MVSDLFFSQLVLIALVWLCLMLQWVWPSDPRRVPDATAAPRPTAKAPPRAQTLCGPHHQAALRCLCSTRAPPAHTPLQPHPRASS